MSAKPALSRQAVTQRPTYADIEAQIADALDARDPAKAAQHVQRALRSLALLACGPNFDVRRDRAVRAALRTSGLVTR